MRPVRSFSEQIKRQVVKDIENGKCSVAQATSELGVCRKSIYNWIYRFSRHLNKNRRMVVEDQSEAYKSQELEKRIKELEAALGRKQLEVDYLNKIIEIAGKEYKTDLKKNIKKPPFSGSDSPKDKPTGTK